ncbi:hypothetical protein BX616_002602 [Lobosporangium transversale]|nr:hypothetical protein BX616_002602 [Lobosporangium transversale]
MGKALALLNPVILTALASEATEATPPAASTPEAVEVALHKALALSNPAAPAALTPETIEEAPTATLIAPSDTAAFTPP